MIKRNFCLLMLVVLSLVGCEKQPEVPKIEMVPMRVGMLNYTDDYIDEIYVNGSWSANVLPHGGGSGGAGPGSTLLPQTWNPEYTLNIEWQTHAWGRDESIVSHERKIATEPYQQDENGRMTFLWVAFFPDGVVKLYPTLVGPRHSDFPDGLVHPRDACMKKFQDEKRCYPLSSSGSRK